MNGSKNLKISSALDYASGTADREGAALDMQGFDGVMMVVKCAAVHDDATYSIKAQQGAASDLSDGADLAGTKIDIAGDDDNQVFVIDVYKPQERYVRLYVDKDTTNACAESAIYIQYGGKELPVVQTVANAVTYELHVSPAEGTA